MLTGDKDIKEMKRYLKIRIDTVDSIQGRDSDVVIFSITRNWGTSFFFANYKRLFSYIYVFVKRHKLHKYGIFSYKNTNNPSLDMV